MYYPMVCWIWLRTSSLATCSLYEMRKTPRKHLISMACILLCRSTERVHVSQAYRQMDSTRERISQLILMLVSFHIGFNYWQCCCLFTPGKYLGFVTLISDN